MKKVTKGQFLQSFWHFFYNKKNFKKVGEK